MSNLKIIGTLALPLLFLVFGCNKTKEDTMWQQLVTNGGLTEAGKMVHPGDIIHAVGEGYEESDEIMLNFYWETGISSYPEGSVKGYLAEIVEKSAYGIQIKLPFRLPEARVEVLLKRGGYLMKLGEVRLADGQTPKEYRLYGINNNLHQKILFRDTALVERITEDIAGRTQWSLDEHPDFHSVTNAWRTYGLCGLAMENGMPKAFFLDFCTGEWKKLSEYRALALAGNGISVVAILETTAQRYNISTVSSDLDKSEDYKTKTPSSAPRQFALPDDLKPEYFGDYPGVFMQSPGIILFSANKGNGTWVPVMFSINSGFHELEEVETEALIPFYFTIPQKDQSSVGDIIQLSGYIITSEEEGSRFCLLNEKSMLLQEPFATYPNRVASVTSTPEQVGTFTVHFIAHRAGFLTEEFHWETKEWKSIEWGSIFDEIVWGN